MPIITKKMSPNLNNDTINLNNNMMNVNYLFIFCSHCHYKQFLKKYDINKGLNHTFGNIFKYYKETLTVITLSK